MKPDVSYSCQSLETDPATRQLWNRAAICQDLIRPAFWMGHIFFPLDKYFGNGLGWADCGTSVPLIQVTSGWWAVTSSASHAILRESTYRPRSVWVLCTYGIFLVLLSFLPNPPCYCLVKCPGWLRVGSPKGTESVFFPRNNGRKLVCQALVWSIMGFLYSPLVWLSELLAIFSLF